MHVRTIPHSVLYSGISFVIILLLLAAPLLPAQAALPHAPGDIPSPILDPNSTAWLSVRNMTSAQFADYFDKKSAEGFMVIDIEVDEVNGTQRVGAAWQKNNDGRGWAEYRNQTASEFKVKEAEMRSKGFRMIDQEAYPLGTLWYYASVFIQNVEKLDWVSYVDQTSEDFGVLFDRYSSTGYLMIDVDAYETSAGMRYAAVWVKNSENLGWYEYRDLTSAEFAQKFDELKGAYRMIDVEGYLNNGSQFYAGIWVENVNGRGWAEWRDLTAKGFGDKWIELRDAGYRLIDYETYPTKDGWRYAGIWRQNSERPNWALKDEVDTLLEDHFDQFDIPGMSVAIAKNGQFLYLRGFGFADIDDAVIAESRTIYRLASVSKAVAGALSMRLVEQNLLNLGNNTRSYAPSLNALHTHTVGQTLSNRSGVGHYEDYPSVSGHYHTALEAAEEIDDEPLVYTPGLGYKYSTHGYTFLGAALEGAVGDPISQIIEDELTTPYALNTLRVEDRTVPNAKRATIYNTSNQEVTADDLSWKVLGGELEASAYDLARFGIKLINQSILTQNSLNTLWAAPDLFNPNYALGWDIGSESFTRVVAKAGAQNGARSYIRMYPDKGYVIVVLTNRKNGGHSPVTLGREIGKLLLANDSLAGANLLQAEPLVEEEELEPAEEAQDPAEVIFPLHDPVAEPSDSDLQEPEGEPVSATLTVFMPLMIR